SSRGSTLAAHPEDGSLRVDPCRRSAPRGLPHLAFRNIDDLHTAIFHDERVFGAGGIGGVGRAPLSFSIKSSTALLCALDWTFPRVSLRVGSSAPRAGTTSHGPMSTPMSTKRTPHG